jgi:hypothetical protein
MNDHKDVPQGLKPSWGWHGAARLKPCPSWREFFPASMGLGKHEWKPQISPPRCALSKNISRRGPRYSRSPGCARDDTGRTDDRFSAAPTALGSSSGSISQPFRAGLTFGGSAPPGLASMATFAVSFLPQLAAGKSAAPNEQKIKLTESISISSVHFTLNLPQASRLLGMTRGRATLP